MENTCEFWAGALKLDGIERADDPSSCAGRCTNGYPIYMVVAPGVDYHFYRMDAPKVWTHKLGGGPNGPVLACDGSNKKVTDPAKANHNYPTQANYSDSCGYFCVCPQNVLDLGTQNYQGYFE